MKKGVLCIAAALVLCTATLSAQISATKLSTAGLFGTDIDDFMDVNYYSGVAPEHLFAFMGLGLEQDTPNYNGRENARWMANNMDAAPGRLRNNFVAGLAHQFSKLYLGAFFNGRIPDFGGSADESGVNEGDNKTAHGDAFDFALLFGFGNIGLKYTLGYAKNTLYDTTVRYDTMLHKLDLGLVFGEDTKILPRFALGVESVFFKDNPYAGEYPDYNDVYSNTILLNAGVGIEFAQNGILQHSVDVDLETAWTIFPVEKGSNTVGNKTTKYEEHGEADNSIAILPAYTLTVSPSDNIDVKVKVGLPISMGFARTPTRQTISDGDVSDGTDVPYWGYNSITIEPTLALGLQYRPRENIALNTGLEIGLPTFLWSINSSPDYSAGADPLKDRVTNPSYSYMNSAFAVKWNTGLSWTIAKIVTLDFNWNILNNILDGFRSNLFVNGTNLWDVVGGVLQPDFAFMLSVKF